MKFELNDEEYEKALEFMNNKQVKYTGAIGGQFTFEFTNTSIGQIKSIKDCVSKETLILTNFDLF